ncbi:MAG: aldo/keto reductase [Deltaproteobacteria bacterium]
MRFASRFGLGLAAIGRPGYITLGRDADLGEDRSVATFERRAHALLDHAWSVGVRHVDTARSYGYAERFLASWLDARGHRPTISSKWGYTYTADWTVDADVHEVKDHGLAVLDRQQAESRALLGDRLGLYQIHSATLDSGVLDDADVHERLHALRAEHGFLIGLSLSGVGQADTLKRALEIEVEGRRLFDAVQATYNVLETSAGAALETAHGEGLAVIVKEGVANGRLTERGLATLASAKQEVLRSIAAANDVTVDAVALAAIASRSWVDVVLSGAVTPAQLDANLAARDLEVDEAVFDDAEAPADYWSTRKALPWS